MPNMFLRFPGNRHKALTFSYDDGPREDIRLVDIFDKHGLKATFNLNSASFPPEEKRGSDTFRLTLGEAIELYGKKSDFGIDPNAKKMKHEVAVHTLTHTALDKLPPAEAAYEIMKDRENLEEAFGSFVCGLAYPYGTYSEEVVAAAKAAGLLYARTVINTGDFRLPEEPLKLTATCHHADPKLMEYARSFVDTDLSKMDRDPLLFYVWGHSFEFSPRFSDNWNVIEEFADYISGRSDIWYATNGEIFEYMEAYKKLRFSMNRRYVRNCSDMEICFFYSEKDYTIMPGETILLG